MNDKVLLRYTGELAKTFLDHCIGQVEPGGTFEVPAGEAERFTRRADVEVAEAAPPKAVKAKAAPKEEASGG